MYYVYFHFFKQYFYQNSLKTEDGNLSKGIDRRTSKATHALVAFGICTVIGQLSNTFNKLHLTYTKKHQKELHSKLSSPQFSAHAVAIEVRKSVDIWYMTYSIFMNNRLKNSRQNV